MNCSSACNGKKQKINKTSALENYLKTSYVLIQSRNLDGFLRKIGTSKDIRQKVEKLKPKIKLTRNHDLFTLTTTYENGKINKIHIELGKPIARDLKNGSQAVSMFLIKGNKLEETQCTNRQTIIVTRAFGPEYLIVTMVADDERCDRFYKRLPKPDFEEIRSETSRRAITDSEASTPSNRSFINDSEIEVCNLV